MSLLELEHVSRRYGRGVGEHVVLRDVSLTLERGELVCVWGLRGCGRTTLLRVAAGVEPPDTGTVRFAGREYAGGAGAPLGAAIGWCRPATREVEAGRVLDELTLAQLARGERRSRARARGEQALERVGASHCAVRSLRTLDGAEAVRVSIARALLSEPELLVIDDATRAVDLLERDPILALLRSLADEGVAILSSASEPTALAGADRALSLSAGELRGCAAPELAPVVPLRRAAGA